MTQVVRIKPTKFVFSINFREIWEYRELLYFFAWKDIKVKYKQTVIGIIWAIIQPVLTMVVFSVFFGQFAKISSEGIPYPIFVYAGLLLWQFFVSNLSDVSNCLINNQSIVTKVYFPRLLLPLSYLLTNLVDFFIAALILVIMMAYFGYVPNPITIIIFPILLILTFLSSTGIGLFLASINAKYRDVRYILPYFIQLLLFVTPVIYPASMLGPFTFMLGINPMAGIISTARVTLFNIAPISWISVFYSALVGIIFFAIGLYSFKKSELYFADVV